MRPRKREHNKNIRSFEVKPWPASTATSLQPFKTYRKRLVPAQRVPAKTKHHALSEGERMGRTAEGVAIIHVTADDETGEVSALEVLARCGVIPEEFEEQIRAA